MTPEKLKKSTDSALSQFIADAEITNELSKDEVLHRFSFLLAGLFLYFVAIDGKSIAIKTILAFLVKITDKNELDKYFADLEKLADKKNS